MLKPFDYYHENELQYDNQILAKEKSLKSLSVYRLVLILLCGASIYIAAKYSVPVLYLASVLIVVIFIMLVKRFQKIKLQKQFQEALLKINISEQKALDGDCSNYYNGNEYVDHSHDFSYDLDLFGQGSLFQMLNRTVTVGGQNSLANYLRFPMIDTIGIEDRQQAVQELSQLADWRQQFLATGMVNKEGKDDKKQIEFLFSNEGRFSKSVFYRIVGVLLPILTFVSWGVYFFSLIEMLFPLLIFFVQLFIIAINIKYVNQVHNDISKESSLLMKYVELLKLVEQLNPESKLLNELKSKIYIDGELPSASFSKLLRLIDALDSRMNILVGIILNGFLLWDINCLIRIERWENGFKEHFPEWIETISVFDMLISFANFRFNNPEYVMPKIENNLDFHLNATSVSHPLINKKETVANDFSMSGLSQLCIITGANMAGKSTFLRTIGVNLVLAMSGSCVCASEFRFTPTYIFSSMRMFDSIQKNASFFFAELSRLKEMISILKQKQPVFILLDEILKGTNSKDQHTGSSRLIKHVLRLGGTGLIATHDVSLTNLQEQCPESIRNIAFEIDIENGEMIFSYKYKEGVCKNMNATILMQQMGIV